MSLRLAVLVVICAPLLVNSMALTQRSLRVSFRRGFGPTAARSLGTHHFGRASSLFLYTGTRSHYKNTRSFPLQTTFHSMSASTSNDNEQQQQYTKSYQLNGVGRKSSVEMTTNTGHVLTTDVPLKMGGGDTAPQPVETLLAALLGCTQATAVFVGRQMQPRILIDRLEFVNIEARRDERGALELPITSDPVIPARLQNITGTIRVYTKGNKGSSLTNEQLKLLSHQTELRCPVANMIIASGCEMNVEWVDGMTMEE